MVAHGYFSSLLFCFSNISSECFGRRSLLIITGLINLILRMAMKINFIPYVTIFEVPLTQGTSVASYRGVICDPFLALESHTKTTE